MSASSALNRVTTESLVAPTDLPRFDRSAVDGYAVRAKDTVGASQPKPRVLRLVDGDAVKSGEAGQIWTGNTVPEGTDAVVMLENTRRLKGKVEVWVQVTPGENVSERGEDVKKGKTAIKAGVYLRPWHLGLLAALGITELDVVKKPKVALMSSGNELVEPGQRPKKGQLFDANKVMLSSLCSELGAEPLDLGIARDDPGDIESRLRRGLEEGDAVVTSGGTSVGGMDLLPEVVNRMGQPGVIVHGVAMRPGMPTALAVVKEKPVLILPGNPVAVMFGFEVFGRPLIGRLMGVGQALQRLELRAEVTRRVTTALGRKNFVRVNVLERDGRLFAAPISAKGSSMISTLTRANGYVVVPEDREGLEAGEMVPVKMMGNHM